jgi:hypothetical protein
VALGDARHGKGHPTGVPKTNEDERAAMGWTYFEEGVVPGRSLLQKMKG